MKRLCETDVLVVGGGPAGIGAALAAARFGARTLLLERHAFLGGIASFCLGMPINQMLPGGKSRSAIHDLLIGRLRAYGEQAVRIDSQNTRIQDNDTATHDLLIDGHFYHLMHS